METINRSLENFVDWSALNRIRKNLASSCPVHWWARGWVRGWEDEVIWSYIKGRMQSRSQFLNRPLSLCARIIQSWSRHRYSCWTPFIHPSSPSDSDLTCPSLKKYKGHEHKAKHYRVGRTETGSLQHNRPPLWQQEMKYENKHINNSRWNRPSLHSGASSSLKLKVEEKASEFSINAKIWTILQ